ncbi:MAG: ABC transporter permease [Chloroflexi bacterium]|nr:ABC transporter permease [Chloroflexota bacterium]
MGAYLAGRLAQAVGLLFVVSVVTFVIIHAAPGGPAILSDPNLTKEQVESLKGSLGLDRPVHEQYLTWVGNVLVGQFGRSFSTNHPVLDLIRDRLPTTLIVSGTAMALSLAIAIPLGIVAAVRRGSWVDNTTTVFSYLGLSVPPFWLGIVLILVFAVWLRALPSGGIVTAGAEGGLGDRLAHLILPTIVLAASTLAQVARYTRSSLLNVLHEDYVRTARAKGVREWRVLGGHAFRNAVIPVVTVVGLLLPRLVSGAAITESVFALPGMGRLAVEAAFQRDYPVIMGVTLVVSAMVIVTNLFVDLLYGYLDPRVKVS